MGLYNFQERFAPRIRQWDADPEHPLAKAHTIRAPRKRRQLKDGTLVSREDKPGSTMHLYTGLRHKGAARIIEPVVCARVESVVFWGSDYPHHESRGDVTCLGKAASVFIGPFLAHVLDDVDQQAYVKAFPKHYGLVELDEGEREVLARRDGFDAFAEMMQYWDGKLPWYGHIFHWRKMCKTVPMSVLRRVKGAKVQ